MLKQVFIALFLFLSFSIQVEAQQKAAPSAYEKEWNKIDSLMFQAELPKSAMVLIQKVYADAVKKNDLPNKIKAQVYLLKAKYNDEENSTKLQINDMEALAASTSGVENAVWQSLLAGLYWQYYEDNRYELYQRTQLATTTSDDIDTWDVNAIMNKTARLFEASLEQKELLQATPVAQYNAIIQKGKNTEGLRPTLYDLLAFKAIHFFEDGEANISRSADAFEIGGNPWFETAERFSSVRIKVKDASSFKFRALRIYQDLIAFHLKDASPEALIDADLNRLEYVHSNSISTQKDTLYLTALQHIVQQYPQSPSSAQASFLIIENKMGEAPVYGRMKPGPKVRLQRNLPQVKKELQAIISKFPKSEGGLNAAQLLNEIAAVNLQMQVEDVNIPDENIKALITYKNVSNVYLSVYKMPFNIKDATRNQLDSLLIKTRNLKPIRSWQQNLTGSEDMEQHSSEIKIDALPAGNYVLVVSDNMLNSQTVIATVFQVSNISFVYQQKAAQQGYLLNRKTGYPIPGVKAYFYGKTYQKNGGRYINVLRGNATANNEGMLVVPVNKTNNYDQSIQSMLFVKDNDSLYLNGYFYAVGDNNNERAQTNTFFFTDRSIYRPGQTMSFKGIMVRRTENGKKNEVVANQSTTVFLYDANGGKKDSLNLKTNEFGSITGSFQLPEGLLNGSMQIGNENGNQDFSVEEYKRPKFFIDFDTVKASYALNENVTVKGFAKAYAGNMIDGAQVKYRVVRRVVFPYYWCYYYFGMPRNTQVEIANGTATTAADGSFDIAFQTIPDRSIDAKTMPVFHYFISADVTDINGETHSNEMQLASGYTSIQIQALIPEDAKPKDLKLLNIQTENLNGAFVSSSVNVTIARLKFPGFMRQRLWEVPDQFVMSETEFRKAFPNDEYKDEANHLNWQKEKVLFEKTYSSKESELLAVPEETWHQNGWYVIEIKTKDAQGNDIVEKKYTHVWAPGKKEPNQQPIMAYAEKDSYEPGDKLELWLGTGVDQPYLLKASSVAYNVRNPIYIDVQEKDRGGMTFSWLYVYNNRVYTLDKTIDVPWTNKDLQMEWATHRDKLLPGAKDQWTVTIKGNKKEKVAAELLAGMYDASLDAFRPHMWSRPSLFPSVNYNAGWIYNWGFGAVSAQQLRSPESDDIEDYEKEYDMLSFDELGSQEMMYFAETSSMEKSKPRHMGLPEASAKMKGAVSANAMSPSAAGARGYYFAAPVIKKNEEVKDDEKPAAPDAAQKELPENVQIRKNLQETAFFFPQLKTDDSGNVSFSFTMPEALTEWKFMSLAHTKDMQGGYMQGLVKTQKDLMVVPNLPRFFRQNDNIVVSTKIVNMNDAALNGNATIQLLDAQTLQVIPLSQFQQSEWSKMETAAQSFNVAKGQSATVTWNLHVPESRYTPVVVRIVAKAGAFSDGEENTLPVLTNRMLVTETLPISMKGDASKTFTLDKLLNNTSTTLSNHALTVEFTGNPAWYAVQALPYLMEYPYECAEQTFNRLYANALARHIVTQSPKVKQVFDQWQQKDSAALISNLQKNEDLKTALLEETPWVMEAKDETEQKHRVALLFQANKMARELDKNGDKLVQMQMSDGSFPWFRGMYGDRFITQYILTGIGRLQHLGVQNVSDKNMEQMQNKALIYSDNEMRNDYEALLKSKAKLDLQQIGSYQVQYLYMRSFYKNVPVSATNKKAYDFYSTQAAKYWTTFNPYLKGQLALALNRMGNVTVAKQIMASLKETSIQNEALGMYWKDMPRGYSWSEAPVESEALLIEAFSEINKDNDAVDAMKLWLLKQKQTQNWQTTKATADACYAFLLNGSNWLTSKPDVMIQLGNEKIESSKMATEAGSGYFEKRFAGKEVNNEMGRVNVTVQHAASDVQGQTSWGAVYWQYFEDMDKVTTATAPIVLKKQLFIEQNTNNGPVLTAITSGNELHVGDKVKMRIEVKIDRDMEYVQLKDMRAACFEPVDVLSQYHYQNGVGYYESTKDLSTNFFFDHLAKGTYVFEYPVWVNAKGNFSNGISTIQCMYAPEFSSHTEGLRVEVK